MALRCFLFSSDEGTAAILRQILSGLGVEGEFCPNAVTAVERITNQPFQIVIIDWDQQPEAGLLLNTARERKAAERPLTLALVSGDADAPQAMQAGANSLLRKPIILNQARETLTTARDLLRAQQVSAANPAATTAAPASPRVMQSPAAASSPTLRAGEFLQTPTLTPAEHFETEAPVPQSSEEFAVESTDPLKDLEPTAASVTGQNSAPGQESAPSGTRGLEWYLKTRVAAQQSASSAAATAPAPVAPVEPAPNRGNPELLAYEQSSTYSSSSPSVAPPPTLEALKPAPKFEPILREQKKEAELFAYIQGNKKDVSSSAPSPSSVLRLGKKAIIPAFVLAAFAIIAAPQAPWHSRLQGFWRSGKQAIHAWLNPQPVTPAPAPISHESFTRAGDEYKLPVAEAIPDATTDPSQIKVVPVIDPTIKKPNNEGANALDPSAVSPDGSTPAADVPGQTPQPQSAVDPPAPGGADPFRPPSSDRTIPGSSQPPPVNVIESPSAAHSNPAALASSSPFTPAQPRTSPPVALSPGKIPPSLKSQIAPPSTVIGGNKPLEAALPSIEPVEVPEAAERLLIAANPSPVFPLNAKGQQGTVILEVVIARDGTVRDTKLMEGSLLFARNAIDAVKQWKFKPYQMNGHPVSVQTQLTIKFRPGQ